MNDKEADYLEKKTGCKPVEFDGVEGLYAFFEPGYTKRIVIAGIHGKTDLSFEMAIALSDQLRGIAEMYMEVS